MGENTNINLSQVRLRWHTCSCFEICTPEGFSIVIDPYIGESKATEHTAEVVEGADLILVSHTHYDHVTDVKYLMDKFGSKVLVGDLSAMDFAKWLDCNPARLYPMAPGQELDFGNAKVKAFFGRHGDAKCSFSDWQKRIDSKRPSDETEIQRWGTLEYRNYLITFPSGFKLLFWGNEDTAEQRAMLCGLKPDVALMQFTRLLPGQLAELAANSGVKILIPHHMDSSRTVEEYTPRIVELESAFLSKNVNGAVICPEHGKWYNIGITINAEQKMI